MTRAGSLAALAALGVLAPPVLASDADLRRLTQEERRQMNAQLAEASFAPCAVLTLAGSRWACRATTRDGVTYDLELSNLDFAIVARRRLDADGLAKSD